MTTKPATTPEPPPLPGTGDLWLDVIEDMKARREEGIRRYGTPLQPWNGRHPRVDAYQEALDRLVYEKQALVEEEALRAQRDILVEAVRFTLDWNGLHPKVEKRLLDALHACGEHLDDE